MALFGPPNVEKLKARRNVNKLIKALNYKKDYDIKTNYGIGNSKSYNFFGFRRAAAKALGELGDRRAVEPLIAALNDDDINSEVVAEALGRIGDARAVKPLIAFLVNHPSAILLNSEKRAKAAEALRNIGTASVEPLIALLTHQDIGERITAAEILGRIGDRRAVEPLIILLGNKDPQIVNVAAGGNISALSWMSSADKNRRVVKVAAEALVQIGDRGAVEPLITLLGNQDSQIVKVAAGALAEIGDRRAVEALCMMANHVHSSFPIVEGALVKIKENWTKKAATETSQQLRNSLAVEPWVGLLGNRHEKIRLIAAQMLDMLGWQPDNETNRTFFTVAHQDWEQAVRLGQVTLVPLLIALKKGEVQIAAAKALGELGDTRALEPLVEAALVRWFMTNEELRVMVKALRQLGDTRAVDAFIAALKHPDHIGTAARVLAEMGDTRAVDPLLTALDALDIEIQRGVPINSRSKAEEAARATLKKRAVVAEALGKIGDRRASEPLLALLNKRYERLRHGWSEEWSLSGEVAFAAAKALHALGWQPNDDVQRVLQATAMRDWEKMSSLGPAAIGPLVQFYKVFPSNEVRIALEHILGRAAIDSATSDLDEIARFGDKIEVSSEYDRGSDLFLRTEMIVVDAGKLRWMALLELIRRSQATRALHALGWRSTDDVQRVYHVIAPEDWEKIPSLGPASAGPLVQLYKRLATEIEFQKLVKMMLQRVFRREAEHISTNDLNEIAHLDDEPSVAGDDGTIRLLRDIAQITLAKRLRR